MRIRPASTSDIASWARQRATLWPELSPAAHAAEIAQLLQAADCDMAALVAEDGSGRIVGFAEAALRHDYVNGCETSPVLFLEGIYVHPAHRRKGVARALCEAVAAWGRSRGCCEFASDTLLGNAEGHAFHTALGFKETERVVYFRKPL